MTMRRGQSKSLTTASAPPELMPMLTPTPTPTTTTMMTTTTRIWMDMHLAVLNALGLIGVPPLLLLLSMTAARRCRRHLHPQDCPPPDCTCHARQRMWCARMPTSSNQCLWASTSLRLRLGLAMTAAGGGGLPVARAERARANGRRCCCNMFFQPLFERWCECARV